MRLTVLLGVLTMTGLCSLSVCHRPRRYHMVYEEMNWADARRYCRDRFLDLATVRSPEDMEDVQSLGDPGLFYGAWIGLYDDLNSWRWSLADQPDHQFRRWAPNEPNNMDSGECCAQMYRNGGTWNDRSCAHRFCAICFDDTEPTEKYISYENLTWSEAQALCRERHTDLASVRNQAENDMVRQMIPSSCTACWIGLHRDCAWKWSDGSGHTFRDWQTGEPNNDAGTVENCASLVFAKGSKWEDWSCDRTAAFICHSNVPEVKKQVVRIKVTRGNSSQDLNSPAVKAAILEQLKQRLKGEEGQATDINVRWVEQSDGKVFHKEDKKKRKKKKKRERKPVLTKMEL